MNKRLEQEMERRWSDVQEMRRHHGYDALVVAATDSRHDRGAFRYLTGLRPPGPVAYAVVLPDRAPVTVLTTRAAACLRGTRAREVRHATEPVTEVVDLLSDAEPVARVGVGGLADVLRVRDHGALTDALPTADLEDATAALDELRAAKSEIEIESLEEAAYIADRCFERLLEQARPGATERALWADVVRLAVSLGAEDVAGSTLLLDDSGTAGAVACRSRPGHRVVLPRDPFALTLALAGPSGSWVELCRPIAFAPSDEAQERVAAAAAAAVETLARRVGPGTVLGEIDRSLHETAREHDATLVGRSGHGIGLDIVEHPRDVTDVERGATVGENAALVLHPVVQDVRGRAVASMADTFVVEAGGARRLSEFPLGVYRPHVWARH